MKTMSIIAAITWVGLWFTPDQLGQRHFQKGEFAQAADAFLDPMWKGISLYRAGEFEQAARTFARRDTAQAHYNQGNSWLMNGKYDAAIKCYDRALEKRPDWDQAEENRMIAIARAKMVEQKGGDMGDQTIGADDIIFDKNAKNEGHEMEIGSGEAMSNQEIQAMWLRRVQTQPADFLKAKFAYQQSIRNEGGSE